jgi:hypothetical protein
VAGFPRQNHCLGGSTGIRHNLWEFRNRNEGCLNVSGRVKRFLFCFECDFLKFSKVYEYYILSVLKSKFDHNDFDEFSTVLFKTIFMMFIQ